MLASLQVFLLIFIVFALSRVVLRLREKVISAQTALFWSFIWISAFAGILSPKITTKIAEFFGVGRGVDIMVYISIAVLFYLVFRVFVMVEDLRHEISELIRVVALKKTSRGKKPVKKIRSSKEFLSPK